MDQASEPKKLIVEGSSNDWPETISRRELSELILKKRLPLIEKEFEAAFSFIKNFDRSVSFFGSAVTLPDNPAYQKANSLARKLSQKGFTIVTGAGPGIMEAANKGAFEAGGRSVGINIKLRRTQDDNRYVTDEFECYYFFVRKVALSFAAEAYIFFPGGFGTLDELFEMLNLIKNQKVRPTPIILVGREYWERLDGFLREIVLDKHSAVTPNDLNLYKITDDEDEIVEIILPSEERTAGKKLVTD